MENPSLKDSPVQLHYCEGCGEPMQAQRSDKRFHSDKCRKHFNKYIRPQLAKAEKAENSLVNPPTYCPKERNSEEIAATKALYLAHQRTLYLAKQQAQLAAQHKLLSGLATLNKCIELIEDHKAAEAEAKRKALSLVRKNLDEKRKKEQEALQAKGLELIVRRLLGI